MQIDFVEILIEAQKSGWFKLPTIFIIAVLTNVKILQCILV